MACNYKNVWFSTMLYADLDNLGGLSSPPDVAGAPDRAAFTQEIGRSRDIQDHL